MATVGTLTVDIAADIARLTKDVEKSRKELRKLRGSANRVASGFKKMEAGIKAVAVAAGSLLAVRKGFDLAFEAAKFQQAEQGFANLAASHGANSQLIIDNLRRVSAGTISTANIMKSAGTAMLLGIPADKLTNLMEIARASARVTGQSVQAAFDDISKGIGRQSKLILDNLGIVVDAKKAYEEYAKENNRLASSLTDVEKKQAFANAAIKSGNQIVRRISVEGKTAAEAMETFTAKLDDMKIFAGKALIFISSSIAGITQLAAATIANILAFAAEKLAALLELGENIPKIGKHFKEAGESVRAFAQFEREVTEEAFKNAEASFEVAEGIFKEVEARGVNAAAIRQEIDAIVEKADAEKKAIEKALALKAPSVITADSPLAGDFGELESMMNREQLIKEHHDRRIQMLMDANATEAQLKQAVDDAWVQSTLQREEMVAAAKQKGFGMAANLMQNLFILTGSKSKAMFKMMKAFAIAQALIDGQVAVMGAYKVGTTIGGPPLGAAYAAVAGAAVAAQIAKIASTSMGGSAGSVSSGGGGGAVPSLPSGGVGADDLIGGGEAIRQQDIIININNPLSGELADDVKEEIVRLINESGDSNINVDVRTR